MAHPGSLRGILPRVPCTAPRTGPLPPSLPRGSRSHLRSAHKPHSGPPLTAGTLRRPSLTAGTRRTPLTAPLGSPQVPASTGCTLLVVGRAATGSATATETVAAAETATGTAGGTSAVTSAGASQGGVPSPERGHARGVVITGATKGLGLAMAAEFSAAGDRVLICGRDPVRLQAALDSLRQLSAREARYSAMNSGHSPEAATAGEDNTPAGGYSDAALESHSDVAREGYSDACGEGSSTAAADGGVFGIVCDVGRAEDVEALASLAREKLGTVHLWINNAGQVTSKSLLSDVPSQEIVSAIAANVTGSILCSREAIRLMLEQPAPEGPFGPFRIFNMGFSKWGASFTRSAATHKATKLALTQLTTSLTEELRQAGVSSIAVHNLSPGMVLTDLLLKDSTPASRRFFNALAEEPETVAEDLVSRIRAMDSSFPSGASLDYLTPLSAFGRVLSRFPQIIQGGRFFDKEGKRVRKEGEEYAENGVRVQLGTGKY